MFFFAGIKVVLDTLSCSVYTPSECSRMNDSSVYPNHPSASRNHYPGCIHMEYMLTGWYVISIEWVCTHKTLICTPNTYMHTLLQMPPYLSMVVGRVLAHRSSQLGHLYLSLVVPLETSEQHLPLPRLQT